MGIINNLYENVRTAQNTFRFTKFDTNIGKFRMTLSKILLKYMLNYSTEKFL